MTFKDLGLNPTILKALKEVGFETPTPVQEKAIPVVLTEGDVLGIAQTGTGKTAAFTLPVIQMLRASTKRRTPGSVRALIVTPTRELAAQIAQNVKSFTPQKDLKYGVIFGGVKQGPQVSFLRGGTDILVATPGRLLDLNNQGHLHLDEVEILILDEADRMLDMGFINDIKRIVERIPDERQTLLFSATMPPAIEKLAQRYLVDPTKVEVTPEVVTVEAIEQRVMFCKKADKKRLLRWIVDEIEVDKAIVFTRTKHGANKLVRFLEKNGIDAAAIHGNKSQGARTRALKRFRDGEIPLLVATDIASRGIDIDDIELVFNYDLPNEEPSYVHRIGRTGRAGKTGEAIAFCCEDEGAYLRDIERFIGFEIPQDFDHPFHDPEAIPSQETTAQKKRRKKRGSKPIGDSGNNGRPPRGSRNKPKSESNSNAGDQNGKPTEKKKRRRRRPRRRGPKTT